jgi:adenylate kinase family enzyme
VDLGARIVVVGSSGAGKSALAERLASIVGGPHVELDAMQHGADWAPATSDELRARVDAATRGERWVADGNYSAVRSLLWERATGLVWIDYSRSVLIRRVVSRSVHRALTRVELWNGNREHWRQWNDPEHPIRWAWSTHARLRAEYERAVRDQAGCRRSSCDCDRLEEHMISSPISDGEAHRQEDDCGPLLSLTGSPP